MGGAGSTAAPEGLVLFCAWETDGGECRSPEKSSAAASIHSEHSAMHLRRKSIRRGFLPLVLMLRVRAAYVNFRHTTSEPTRNGSAGPEFSSSRRDSAPVAGLEPNHYG